ncbi:MAG: TolC family protein [Cyclobacteriaceae bacterium]|nr:TolC family protein [Cyclobacteriaceae bacterium]
MFRCFLILIPLIYLFPITGAGQDPDEYSLQECIDYALENSYQQRSLELEIRERQAGFNQKKSAFLPTVDSYVDYVNYFNDLPTYIFPASEGSILSGGTSEGFYPVELGLPHNMNIGLKINQVVYDQDFFLAGRFKNNLSAINQLNNQLTREEIIYNVSQTFYQAASLKSQMDLIAYHFERLDRIEKMLDSQIKNGFARESERSKIRINRSKLITGKNQAETGFKQMMDYLKFQMGMPVEDELTISLENINLEEKPVPDTVQVKNNIMMQLLESRMEISQLEEQQIKNDFYPKLNAFAQFRFQAQREAFDFFSGNESWYLINLFGIRLDIPIIHGGEKRRSLEMMEIKNTQMELDRIRLMENLKIEYSNSKNELLNSREAATLQEENVELAREAFEQTTALFTEGLVPLNELLETEATYREMQSELSTARYKWKLAELKYLKTTGNLLNHIE